MNAKLQLVNRARETVDLGRLARMKPDQLRKLHRKMFECDIASGNSEQARRRIAWLVQSQKEGGLPESARQHALEIAREADVRIRARGNAKRRDVLSHASVTAIVSDHDPRLPMPGSVIVKEYHGQTISVHVLDNGFEWNAQRFTSLSAIATEITGTKWNGLLFFGLATRRSGGR